MGLGLLGQLRNKKSKFCFSIKKLKKMKNVFYEKKKLVFLVSITRKNEFSLFELSIFNNKIVQKESYLAIII